jgi:hypothetical protein
VPMTCRARRSLRSGTRLSSAEDSQFLPQ